jgi:hypothetical protein
VLICNHSSDPSLQPGKEAFTVKRHRAAQTARPGAREQDPHRSQQAETGARRGEHSGRARNPHAKVTALAWREFEKPDLDNAQRFWTDGGFVVADRTPEVCCCAAGGPARRASSAAP